MGNFYIENTQKKTESLPFLFHIEQPPKQGPHTNPHIHDFIELLYCHKGSYLIYLNGTEHRFEKGDLIIINPNIIHSVYVIESGEYDVIQFAPELLYSAASSTIEPRYIFPFVLQDTSRRNLFRREVVQKTEIGKTIEKIVQEYKEKKYGYELALKIYSEQIFLWIIRIWYDQGVFMNEMCNSEKWSTAINQVLSYIWEHYEQDIAAEEMAKLCFVTYGHFASIFKRVTGYSFTKYLNRVRIEQAKKLLIGSDKSVTEIAGAVGFNSASYFIEQFRQIEGIPPFQYKKQNKR